jgi:hypothetical protein
MELKQRLQDYTEPEFLNFVKKIWAVDVPEDEHDKLVMHFDKICQYPMGSDLLFYSDDFDNESSPENVVDTLKQFRTYKNLPGFQEQRPGESPVGSGGNDAPVETTTIYYAPYAKATEGPLVMAAAAGAMAAFEVVLPAIQEATLNAVALLTRMAAAANNGATDKYVNILLFSTKLGNSERYALSMPLSELAPDNGQDWQSIASAKGEVDLPFRLGSGTAIEYEKEMAQVYLAVTDGQSLRSSVRVRKAIWAPHMRTYNFTSEDSAAITLVWTPDNRAINVPSHLPDASKKYPGIMISGRYSKIETFSTPSDARFDDYVIVFPADAGLAPLYVMFKNRAS